MFRMKKRMSEAEKEKSLGKGISLKWAIASSSGPASMPMYIGIIADINHHRRWRPFFKSASFTA